MFSLIISIISIALVAALAAATVYFGGSAFNKGAAGADASAFVNAGQQIAGAFTLADADGVPAAAIADLNPDYLAQTPSYKGATLVLASNYIAVKVSESVCLEVVKRVDSTATVVADLAAPTGLFGCASPTAAGNLLSGSLVTEFVAFYKVK